MYATPHPVYPYDPSSLSHLTNQHSALPPNQLVPTSTTSGKFYARVSLTNRSGLEGNLQVKELIFQL